jgi:hypothetical protein
MIWLKLKLRKLKSESKPDKTFTIALKHELLTGKGQAPVYRTTVIFRYALAPIALALILGVGTTSYAYASPSVCNGNILFPLKSGVEHMERTVFYASPQAQVKYQVKTFARRADEVNYAIDHGAPAIVILRKVPEEFTITKQRIAGYRKAQHEEEERESEERQEMEDRAENILMDFRRKIEKAPIEEHEREQVLFLIDQRLAQIED